MKRISAILDPNCNPLVGLNNSDYVDARVLASGVAEVHTIPTDAKYVIFSGTTDFFAKIGGAAEVPSDDVTDGSASILNPYMRSLDGATTIGLIASTTCIVTMEFYK